MLHELKLSTEFFDDVSNFKKSFEIRKNDRNYKIGDILGFNEYDLDNSVYTGRSCFCYVEYVFNHSDYVIDDYVILGIRPCSVNALGLEVDFESTILHDTDITYNPKHIWCKGDCNEI